jgi:hypothetical protein
MILTGGKPKYPTKKLSLYHFVHHKFYWIALRSNRDLRGERPATNRRKVKVLFLSKPPDFQRALRFGRFPGFARVSLCSEPNVDEDESRAMVNVTDRGKPKYWEKTLSQCQFLDHKFHVDCAGVEPGLLQSEAGDYPQ